MTTSGESFPVPEKNSPEEKRAGEGFPLKKKGFMLLVIDSRTAIAGTSPGKGRVGDFRPGDRVTVKHRIGWDALQALAVKKPDE